MKNFFSKIDRFIRSRNFLILVLGVVALIIFVYVEEDLRAEHQWAALKTKWGAKGISFDRQAYTPEEVPDEQNLAAIPLFTLELPPSQLDPTFTQPLALRKALRTDQPGRTLPSTGNYQRGQPLDMAKIQETIAKSYADAFNNSTPPPDTLTQLEALYPFIADLRSASDTHPLCRFDENYTNPLPAVRPLELLTSQIAVSKILTLHANLALAEQQPDIAMGDLKVNFKLMSGVMQDPSLVGGLVGIGMNGIATSAIYNGIAQHAWSDPQLAALEDALGHVDFLQKYQFTMKSEAMANIAPNFDYFKKNRSYSGMMGQQSSTTSKLITLSWPSGWYDFNKISTVEALLISSEIVDPAAHRLFIEKVDDLQKKADERNAHWSRFAPWNIFSTISSGPLLSATRQFAQAQVWIDETRIACALERYRLANNAYPPSLDALTPAYIAAVPHDIITGDPYHYQLQPKGTFLLYSVGWNGTDDGGKIAYKQDAPTQIDYSQGDWIWPTPRVPKP